MVVNGLKANNATYKILMNKGVEQEKFNCTKLLSLIQMTADENTSLFVVVNT